MVVVAVLVILLGVAVPSMHGMLSRNRLKAAGQAIAEDLQWARSEAIKRNRPVALSLKQDPWCYGVTMRDALDCDCRPSATDSQTCELKAVTGSDYPGTTLSATFERAVFEPRRATATNGSLTLTSPQGLSLKVILSRLGRIRLCSPNGVLAGHGPC